MSKSGPGALIEVGDTDYWDQAGRVYEMQVGPRLREVATLVAVTPTARTIRASLTRDTRVGRYYAEILVVRHNPASSGNARAGVMSPTATITALGGNNQSDNLTYLSSGDIRKDVAGTLQQTGLTAWTQGGRVGIEIYDDDGTPKIQFWFNGSTVGTAETLNLTAVRLHWSAGNNDSEGLLLVDRHELKYLPPGRQPWGSAARVSDAGGYSPASSRIETAGPNITVSSYRRLAAGVGMPANSESARLELRARPTFAALVYCEFLYEVASAPLTTRIGIANGSASMSAVLGSTSASWAYLQDGNILHNGSSTATGVTWTVGDRPGWYYNPTTGGLWFAKNGVPISGDPEAGTGAHYTLAPRAAYAPAASPVRGGSVRFHPHGREQLNRALYATAWDGGDVLPEQHFGGYIQGFPRVRREVSFAPDSRQRPRRTAIGAIDLANDGRFDDLADYNLRDQKVIAYRLDAGQVSREWIGAVDNVDRSDMSTCRINVDDSTGVLEQRVNAAQFVMGTVSAIPITPRQSTTLIYDFAQTPWIYADLSDLGIPYALGTTTWRRSDTATSAGFQRTANPAGMQSAIVMRTFYPITTIALTNGDFSSWSGGLPVGWTVRTAGGSTVAQNGSSARLNAAGGGGAGVSQVIAPVTGKWYGVRVTINAVHAGTGNDQPYAYLTDNPANTISGGAWNGTSVLLHSAGGTGVYYGSFWGSPASSTWTSLLIAVFNGVQRSIDLVEFFELGDTAGYAAGLQYLFTILPPTPVRLSFADCPGNYPVNGASAPRFGYWTKGRDTIREIIDRWLRSEFADWYVDAEGVARVAWMLPPEEFTSGTQFAGTILEKQIIGDLIDEDELAPGLTDTLGYSENYAVHSDTDIAGGALAVTRNYLTSDRLTNKLDLAASTAAAAARRFHAFYAHGVNGEAMPRLRDTTQTYSSTLTHNLPDAVTPANRDNSLIRLHRVFAKRRRPYTFQIARALADRLQLRPGRIIRVFHSRYGLSAGKYLQVMAEEKVVNSPTVTITARG